MSRFLAYGNDETPNVDRKKGAEQMTKVIKASLPFQADIRLFLYDQPELRGTRSLRHWCPPHVMKTLNVQNNELIVLGNGSLALTNAGLVILDKDQLESCVPKTARNATTQPAAIPAA